jgi:hypothetical protein
MSASEMAAKSTWRGNGMKDSERLILLNAELQWLRLELERSDLKKE